MARSGIMDFLALLGTLGLTAAVLTGAAFTLFKLFGDRWLTAKFNERLEAYKHAQQKELETLRFKINALMDRTAKLHQHEFDALPELWSRLNEAIGHVSLFASPLQTYADLDRMSEAHLDDFLEKSDLAKWQKDSLRTGDSKTERHAKIRFWYDLHHAQEKYQHFNSYFAAKSIFLEPELKARMVEIRDMMYDALFEKQFEEQHPNPRPGRFEKAEELRKNGRAKLDEIGAAVQNRLWNARFLEGANAASAEPEQQPDGQSPPA